MGNTVTGELYPDARALRMSPAIRKLALVAHVASSVGWLGAVVAFLVLSIAALSTSNADTARSAYLAMNVIGQFAIVPFGILALITGVIQSIGTHWGLLRYYWVVTKLALTIDATSLLLLHQFKSVAVAARRASATAIGMLPVVGGLGKQLVFDASFAAVVLLVTTILSIYKPWGLIQPVPRRVGQETSTQAPIGVRIVMVVLSFVLAIVIALHLTGHGMGHHGM